MQINEIGLIRGGDHVSAPKFLSQIRTETGVNRLFTLSDVLPMLKSAPLLACTDAVDLIGSV